MGKAILILLSLVLFYGESQAQKCPEEIMTFNMFWVRVQTNSNLSKEKLEFYSNCIFERTRKKAEQKDPPLSKLYGTYPEATDFQIRSHTENTDLSFRIITDSLDSMDPKDPDIEKRVKAFFDYSVALNNCISEDLTKTNPPGPNRLGLRCGSEHDANSNSSRLTQAKNRLTPLFPNPEVSYNPNPIPKLDQAQKAKVCPILNSLEDRKHSIQCWAKTHCETIKKGSNSLRIGGLEISSPLTDMASHYKNNRPPECSNVPLSPLPCFADVHKGSAKYQERQYKLGLNDRECLNAINGDGIALPKYNDKNKHSKDYFYDNSCNLNWSRYASAYQRTLIDRNKLEVSYIDCAEPLPTKTVPRATSPRGGKSGGSR